MTLATPEEPRQLSGRKKLLGILGLLLVMVGCTAMGFWMAPERSQPAVPVVNPVIGGILAAIIGVVGAVITGGVYLIFLFTACFTFDYSRPFFKGFKARFWFANTVVGLLRDTTVGYCLGMLLVGILIRWLSPNVALIASFLGMFVASQLFFIWFQMWAPMYPLIIRRRLRRMGITPDQFRSGIPIGTSDPTKNSFKKMTLVEDDIGMLWITPDALIYYGDSRSWIYQRDQILQIERRADAGSVLAYFGGIHVILHAVSDPAQPPTLIRLHIEQGWTATSQVRHLNHLAERLNAWKIQMTPAIGFAVMNPSEAGSVTEVDALKREQGQ